MATKFFRTITPVSKSEKSYKEQNKIKNCAECGGPVDEAKDHFEITCYWKIKNQPDRKGFCSIECLHKWSAEEEETKF